MLKNALAGLWATCLCFTPNNHKVYARGGLMRLPRVGLFLSVLMLAISGSVAPVHGAGADIVLYTSEVTTVQGNWAKASAAAAAGGQEMASVDQGWASADAPIATPLDYFEATFPAPTATTYHVWLRLRGTNNSKYNESVWVQFSDATDPSGAAVYRLGTTSGLLVNLEPCSGCGVAGWGWQDKGYWTAQSPLVRFGAGGTHTIRVQTREDGVQIDQIVLSPATYLTSRPGQSASDATIVPQATTPSPTATSTPFSGSAVTLPGTIAAQEFDNGGEGVAYHDTTAGNAGGASRATDVDLAASTDGGTCVGWTAPGEWLTYSVTVSTAGSYTLQLRVASTSGATLHVGFTGSNGSSSVTVPNTAGGRVGRR